MRRLHFGCGPNKLPAPWENYDRDVNIALRLPFEDASAAFIYAEHVIEHVPFVDGMSFLSECRRVLEPGGVLRFGFPDVTRFWREENILTYLEFLKSRSRRAADRGDVYRYIMLGSGHRACWTRDVACAAVAAVGFQNVVLPKYGESAWHEELRGLEGHHHTSSVAELETTIVEATK